MDPRLIEVAANLEELARRRREDRLTYYRPYLKQEDFHRAGQWSRERMFAAGNQLGKTLAGAMEMAAHLTGRYPAWWQGRRFNRPIRAWAAGVTGEATRDNAQRLLVGVPHGTGCIPKDCLFEVRPSRGLADAIDTVYVKHTSGQLSSLVFKSYERGRAKWQSETLHALWMDEEPPEDIYTEALARITATRGIIYTTFTPLLGMTDVARRFFLEHSHDRELIRMELEEALHIPTEERQRIIDGYPEHEREARTKGIPTLGSGRVYPVAESIITVPAFAIPDHWPRIAGLDFGWDHPTAAVWLAWDRDSNTVYVIDCYRQREAIPAVHAAAINARGKQIPIAWPADGMATEKGSGTALADLYRKQGVNLMFEPAKFDDGSRSVEAGIQDILQRMMTYRFKVFNHLTDWLGEFRMYHRKDGLIAKAHDDLMDATRYAVMMLSRAVSQTEQKARRTDYAEYRGGKSWKTM